MKFEKYKRKKNIIHLKEIECEKVWNELKQKEIGSKAFIFNFCCLHGWGKWVEKVVESWKEMNE